MMFAKKVCYIYIYIYLYVYIIICIHIYIYLHVCKYVYIYTHTYTCSYMNKTLTHTRHLSHEVSPMNIPMTQGSLALGSQAFHAPRR